MVDPREEQRTWLRAVLAKTGLAPYALAKKARISAPTLTVFLNNPESKHALSARTVAALEEASGMRFGPEPRVQHLREPEAAPYAVKAKSIESDLVKTAIGDRNAVAPWTLTSRALESAGYMPGDILIVDLNAGPQPGDVVCAQIYDWARAHADTVFRIYEPHYLLAATMDPKLRRPLVVDNENVKIAGVVIASVRQRQARAA